MKGPRFFRDGVSLVKNVWTKKYFGGGKNRLFDRKYDFQGNSIQIIGTNDPPFFIASPCDDDPSKICGPWYGSDKELLSVAENDLNFTIEISLQPDGIWGGWPVSGTDSRGEYFNLNPLI